MGNSNSCCSRHAIRKDDQLGSEGIDGVLRVIDEREVRETRGEKLFESVELALETEAVRRQTEAEHGISKAAEKLEAAKTVAEEAQVEEDRKLEAAKKAVEEEAAKGQALRKAQEEVAKQSSEEEGENKEDEAKRKRTLEKIRPAAAKQNAAKKHIDEIFKELVAPPSQVKKAAAKRRAAARQKAAAQQRATIPFMFHNQCLGVYPAQVVNEPAPPPSGKKRALLIGINYFHTEAELPGCIDDVQRMLRMLTAIFSFQPQDIRILTDNAVGSLKSATRENILRGMQWLVQDVQPGDCLFFHYSGHGAQQQDPNCAEDDCYDETMCPEDFEEAGMIVEDEIFDILVGPLPHGVKLTAVIDCCHCGLGLDLPFVSDGLGWIEEDHPCHSAGDVQLISACQDDDCSFHATGIPNKPAGSLTSAFCGIMEREPNMNYTQLLEELCSALEVRGSDQLPSLSSSQSFEKPSKTFSLTDGIVGNMNTFLGRHSSKAKHPRREDLLSGGLGEILSCGAAGFMKEVLADAADAHVIGSKSALNMAAKPPRAVDLSAAEHGSKDAKSRT